jgi:hypothetical protein
MLDLERINEDNSEIKTLEWQVANTKVSVNDLISYLIWWWELVLKWNKKVELWEDVVFPEVWYKWNELWKLAIKFYWDYEGLNFSELVIKLKENNSEIIKLIKSKSPSELYWVWWYWKWTLGRMIQFNTSSPYKNIRTRIRKWLKMWLI